MGGALSNQYASLHLCMLPKRRSIVLYRKSHCPSNELLSAALNPDFQSGAPAVLFERWQRIFGYFRCSSLLIARRSTPHSQQSCLKKCIRHQHISKWKIWVKSDFSAIKKPASTRAWATDSCPMMSPSPNSINQIRYRRCRVFLERIKRYYNLIRSLLAKYY